MREGTGAARRTPYEVVFGDAVFEDERFPAIAAEAEARGAGDDPGAFVMLGSVGELLRTLRPDGNEAPGADAVLRYGALVYQAYHFQASSHPLYTVDDEALRHLLDLAEIGPWPLRAPATAGYVQLPRHRLWVGEDATGTPEPVDGFFWTVTDTRLDIIVCTGLRPDRPGLGAIEVSAALPADPPGHWGDLEAREDGADFSNLLPGGDLDGLLGLTTAAEVLKLVSRTFWFACERAGPAEPVRDIGEASQHALPPSRYAAIPLRPEEGD